jgi:hypothetical protein
MSVSPGVAPTSSSSSRAAADTPLFMQSPRARGSTNMAVTTTAGAASWWLPAVARSSGAGKVPEQRLYALEATALSAELDGLQQCMLTLPCSFAGTATTPSRTTQSW